MCNCNSYVIFFFLYSGKRMKTPWFDNISCYYSRFSRISRNRSGDLIGSPSAADKRRHPPNIYKNDKIHGLMLAVELNCLSTMIHSTLESTENWIVNAKYTRGLLLTTCSTRTKLTPSINQSINQSISELIF